MAPLPSQECVHKCPYSLVEDIFGATKTSDLTGDINITVNFKQYLHIWIVIPESSY